jgi:hypothetical protein
MMSRSVLAAALSLVLAGLSAVPVPDPLAPDNPVHPLDGRAEPGVGDSFTDAAFGTSLMRVTEPASDLSGRHEYSRFDPFNRDQSMILLLPEGAWGVYRTGTPPYNSPANLVTTLDVDEPRWDRVERDLVWGLRNLEVVTVNVTNGQETIVKDFAADPTLAPILAAEPDIYRVTTMSEGEPSLDKRYWALELQGSEDDYRARYIVVWDREADQILGLRHLQPTESNIDWVGMSPKGTWVLIGGAYDNGGGLAGLTIATRDLAEFHRIDYATAHSDVGLDTDGNEVIVMQSERTDYVDLLPLDPSTKPILTAGGSYAGTNRVKLIKLNYDNASPFNLGSGVHISCNVPGYCVVSTTTEPGVPERNWLDRTITLVRLDRSTPRVFYLAKVHNTTSEYWEETHGSVTNDGARVVWASNWGQNVGLVQMSLIQATMPSGSILAPSLIVLAPNGGQQLRAGAASTIGWTGTGFSGAVTIEFSTNGGQTWNTVDASAANTGAHPWAVPDVQSANCLVRITSVTTPSVTDVSDVPFAVSGGHVVSFTDNPLVPGTAIKAVHVQELRSAIASLRATAGLSAYAWTDPTLTARATVVKRVHVAELRAALNEVYASKGLSLPAYTDPTIAAQSTMVKTAHIAELRAAILAVW